MKKRKGFTLLELVVVLGIIALLLTFAIPKYQSIRETAEKTQDKANMRMIKNAALLYITESEDPIPEGQIESSKLSDYFEDGFPTPPKSSGGSTYIVNYDGSKITVTKGEATGPHD